MKRTASFAALPLLAALGLSGCGSLFESRSGEVSLTTTPPGAHCLLQGRRGYSAEVDTPAKLRVPTSAAPVDITCVASRYRSVSARMDIASDGWIVRNSAALSGIGADGLSLIGIGTGHDDARDKPKNDYSMELAPITPHPIRIRQRDGAVDSLIQP
jgi:hypothetical protein